LLSFTGVRVEDLYLNCLGLECFRLGIFPILEYLHMHNEVCWS
jgi:hypothetical protein